MVRRHWCCFNSSISGCRPPVFPSRRSAPRFWLLRWCTGAYASEILRAGLNSVPQGQREATNALGMSRADALRFVIIPQGVRVAIPALLGFSILVFQGTSLCFTIALQEIISRAYDIGNTTFLYFPALAVAGLFYAAVCIPASLLVSAIEHRAGHYARS